MVVVCDTSVITTLLKTGDEGILQRLYLSVHVPTAVKDELLLFHSELPSFIEIHPVGDKSRLKDFEKGLGRGEADAIALALDLEAALFLSDDRKAISVARKLGLESSGLIGVAIEAKELGLISSVRVFIERLEGVGGLYVSEDVKLKAFGIAGE